MNKLILNFDLSDIDADLYSEMLRDIHEAFLVGGVDGYSLSDTFDCDEEYDLDESYYSL